MSFVPLNGLPQDAVLSPLPFIFYTKGFLQDADLTYKYADDSTSLSSKENLSTSLEKAENYTYKWRQMLNKDKTEQVNFSKQVFQSDFKFVERSKTLGRARFEFQNTCCPLSLPQWLISGEKLVYL